MLNDSATQLLHIFASNDNWPNALRPVGGRGVEIKK